MDSLKRKEVWGDILENEYCVSISVGFKRIQSDSFFKDFSAVLKNVKTHRIKPISIKSADIEKISALRKKVKIDFQNTEVVILLVAYLNATPIIKHRVSYSEVDSLGKSNQLSYYLMSVNELFFDMQVNHFDKVYESVGGVVAASLKQFIEIDRSTE